MENLSSYIWYISIPLIFIAIVIYVYRPGAKRRYRKDAEIPFEDDQTNNKSTRQ